MRFISSLDDGDGTVFLFFLKELSEFFSFSISFSLSRKKEKTLALTHPESEPGFEVTAAVTRKVIGAMTTVWHAPPPAPARVPARPAKGKIQMFLVCFVFR